MGEVKRTKTGKLAKETYHHTYKSNNGKFVKYFTDEEFAEQKRLYEDKAKYPDIDLKALINVEYNLKEQFSIGLKRVLEYIEPNYTTLWVEAQSKVSRVIVQRMLRGQYTPSLQNFYRLLYFIEQHIDNFNVWSLIDYKAPIQRTDGYTPFEEMKGVVFTHENERNTKKRSYDVLDLPRI